MARTEPLRNELQDIEDEFYDARGYTDIKAAIPSPSFTQKEEIRAGLKQAFFAKTAVSLLVSHFGTLDLCLAYIGNGLPGDLMLFYDYDATLKTLMNTRKRKTTPLLALTLCLMALCYGIHFDIAWKYSTRS